MTTPTPTSPDSLRPFLTVWSGQLVSVLGTKMSGFAVALWLFEETGLATTLTLVILAGGIPQIFVNLIAGEIVDRYDRKRLIILGDLVAGLVTIAYLALFSGGHLAAWHIYLGAAIAGPFGTLQGLAYRASLTSIVPERHYVRTGSLGAFIWYSTNIISPALAAWLYPTIGLGGIFIIDLLTFVAALLTIAAITIPRPAPTVESAAEDRGLARRLTAGFRFIWGLPALRALLLVNLVFTFFHDLAGGLGTPLVLARTGNNEAILASISAASGASGMMMALLLSAWGGPQRRARAYLLSTMSAGVGKTLFGLSRSLTTWAPAQFYTSANFPVRSSAYQAIWLANVDSGRQGRVFAANSILTQLCGFAGIALAGPLGDYVFEPALAGDNAFSWLVGSGPGAGFSLLYVFAGLGMMAAAVGGWLWPQVRRLDK